MITVYVQDRTGVVKVDGVQHHNPAIGKHVVVGISAVGQGVLGEYKTKERCLDIIKDIVKHIEQNNDTVYRMPIA